VPEHACPPPRCPQSTSKAAADYTALVRLAADEFHAALPGSTVSVDVPWSPYDIDGRNYDWAGLAAAADLLFVMVYDTQSQVRLATAVQARRTRAGAGPVACLAMRPCVCADAVVAAGRQRTAVRCCCPSRRFSGAA
jgi:hypothetical protein